MVRSQKNNANMPPKPLSYATTAPGTVLEVRQHLHAYGIAFVSPAQIGLAIEMAEMEQTLEENAILKAKAYCDHVPHMGVLVDDTGVEIDALHGGSRESMSGAGKIAPLR
jgi:inosine/xanthosine triphosphate pyrophosphatase family protein